MNFLAAAMLPLASFSVFLFVLLPLASCEGNLKPSNTLTRVGKKTNFTCCSSQQDGKVRWKRNDGGLFNNVCLRGECPLDEQAVDGWIDNQTPGCFNLIFNHTSLNLAGLYQCNDGTNTYGAYLVVYSIDCDCEFDVDSVKFCCKILWEGKLPFEVWWLSEDGTEIQKREVSETNYTSCLSLASVRNHPPSYHFHFLTTGVTDRNVDQSFPSANWSVFCPPTNMRISCPYETGLPPCKRKLGDKIYCQADGYPKPSTFWQDYAGLKMPGPVLTLNTYGTHKYTCTAKNTIRGSKKKTESSVVVDVEEKAAQTITVTQSSYGWISVFVVVALFIAFRMKKRIFDYLCRCCQKNNNLASADNERNDLRSRPRCDESDNLVPQTHEDITTSLGVTLRKSEVESTRHEMGSDVDDAKYPKQVDG